MSFYGKIYAQMDNVFDSFYFDNAENSVAFPVGKLNDFVLGAESFNDKMIMKAGNSWIQFIKIPNPISGEHGDAVEIYHGPPMTDKAYAGSSKKAITNIQAGNLYNKLISDNSTLLTQREKDTLKGYRSEGKLLFFGDTITISSPTYDKAGHITGYDVSSYILSEIPRLEEFLEMSNDVIELQEIVGVEGYPEECAEGTLGFRVFTLEDAFESVKETAQTADELAKQAAESAADAAESAAAAAESAKNAEELANRVYESLEQYQAEVEEDLVTIDKKYSSLVKAVGVTDNVQIENQKPDLETPDIFHWMVDQDEKIAQNESDLRSLERKEQSDIDTINNRIDREVSILNNSINSVESTINNRVDNEVLTLNGRVDNEVLTLNGRIDNEVSTLNGRIDNEVAGINANIAALTNTHDTDKQAFEGQLTSLNDNLNSNKLELQGNIDALEGKHNDLSLTVTNNQLAALKAIEDESAALQGQIDTNKTNIETLQMAVGDNKTAIEGLQTQINNNQSGTNDIIGELPEDQESIATWIGTVTNLVSTQYQELDGRITTNNTNLSSLSGEVEVLQGTVNDVLLEQLATLQQTVAQLQERIAILEGYHSTPDEEPEIPTE